MKKKKEAASKVKSTFFSSSPVGDSDVCSSDLRPSVITDRWRRKKGWLYFWGSLLFLLLFDKNKLKALGFFIHLHYRHILLIRACPLVSNSNPYKISCFYELKTNTDWIIQQSIVLKSFFLTSVIGKNFIGPQKLFFKAKDSRPLQNSIQTLKLCM